MRLVNRFEDILTTSSTSNQQVQITGNNSMSRRLTHTQLERLRGGSVREQRYTREDSTMCAHFMIPSPTQRSTVRASTDILRACAQAQCLRAPGQQQSRLVCLKEAHGTMTSGLHHKDTNTWNNTELNMWTVCGSRAMHRQLSRM